MFKASQRQTVLDICPRVTPLVLCLYASFLELASLDELHPCNVSSHSLLLGGASAGHASLACLCAWAGEQCRHLACCSRKQASATCLCSGVRDAKNFRWGAGKSVAGSGVAMQDVLQLISQDTRKKPGRWNRKSMVASGNRGHTERSPRLALLARGIRRCKQCPNPGPRGLTSPTSGQRSTSKRGSSAVASHKM